MRLKPCPVCGSSDTQSFDHRDGWCTVRCMSPFCDATLVWPSCGGVAAAWNALPRKGAKKRKARGKAGR